MLPKKQPPLVRAETICCVIAAVLAAFCLMAHPASRWLLAAILVLLIAASAPPAALLSMFSAKFGCDTSLASSLVSVQTAISALTMPVMVGLAQALA